MTVTWRKLYPKDSTMLKDLPILHSDNFNVIQSAAEYEHYSMASGEALSGYHRPGTVGLIYEGTTTEINALSNPLTGAIAYDTTLGVFKYYTAAGAWVVLSVSTWSRVRAYLDAGSEMAVTSGAAAAMIVFDATTYDTMGEYNFETGTFTTLASGYYLINANACFVASGSQLISATTYPAANAISTQFTPSGATNWDNVEEAVANDADSNLSKTTGHVDLLSGAAAITDVPANATDITVQVNWRAKKAGCVCNNECYSQDCTCYTTCYAHSCTCNLRCYGYASCSCNNTCYVYDKTCVCYYACYGYTSCICNIACYQQSCTCNTGYGYGTGCDCYNLAYGDDAITMNSALYLGSDRYDGDTLIPESAFTNYADVWNTDPSTSLEWTPAAVSAISGFGYRIASVSAGDSTLTGWVSQCNLRAAWYPTRPAISLHIYVNSTLLETAITPIYESKGSATYQTASIASIVWLEPTDTVDIRVQKTLYNDTISAGSALTNLSIHRLVGPLG